MPRHREFAHQERLMFILDDMKHDLSTVVRGTPEEGLISAVIPVYGLKSDTLPVCLDAILGQSYRPIEIILVNNGMRYIDTVIAGYRDRIKVLDLDQNYGASYARNHGAIESRGEYLWFVDSDVVDIDPDCVRAMVDILKENQDIGAVGGLIYNTGPGRTALHIGQCIDPNYGDHPEVYTLFDDQYVNTGCLMVRRNEFALVQGFTEYIEYLYEDSDFGFKIRAAGLRCVGDRRAFALHAARPYRPRDLAGQKMTYKNTLLCFMVNYRLQELLAFFREKLSRHRTEGPGPNDPLEARPAAERAAILFRKLYAMLFDVFFLAVRAPHVARLRRDRQELLKQLRSNDNGYH